MSEFQKPTFNSVWAENGEKSSLSDPSVQAGWTSVKPSFQKANALENRQDAFCAHVNQHGIPVWDNSASYLANKSYVTGSDGEIYRAVTDNIGVNPVGDTSNSWYKPLDDFYTKSEADSRYLSLGVPSGAVFHFAMQTAPAGYLVCNGSAVSRIAFAALFAAIGTTYGSGNGSTTFNLPDLRGEFLRGADLGRGVDGGRTFGSFQKGTLVGGYDDNNLGADVGFLPNHNTQDYGSDGVVASDYGLTEVVYAQTDARTSVPVSAANIFYAVTRPRNIALLPCIKV